VHFEHVNAARSHFQHKVGMVALGHLDPQHIVKQQVVFVAGGKALVGQTRRAHHHLAQRTHFRVNAVG
jgi:hypothetical protein